MTVRWPGGDPHDVARAVLAEPRFRGQTQAAPPGPTLIGRAFAWIFERLRDLFHGIDHALGASSGVSRIAGEVVLLASAVGVCVLIVRFVRTRGRAPAIGTPGTARLERVLTSADLVEEARRFARAERWHEAASSLVRAALLALDETGRLRFDPARTAAEARSALHDPGFDAFEREATSALFAAGAADADRFARLRAAYAQTFGVPA